MERKNGRLLPCGGARIAPAPCRDPPAARQTSRLGQILPSLSRRRLERPAGPVWGAGGAGWASLWRTRVPLRWLHPPHSSPSLPAPAAASRRCPAGKWARLPPTPEEGPWREGSRASQASPGLGSASAASLSAPSGPSNVQGGPLPGPPHSLPTPGGGGGLGLAGRAPEDEADVTQKPDESCRGGRAMQGSLQLPQLAAGLAGCQSRGSNGSLFFQPPPSPGKRRGSYSHLFNGRWRLQAVAQLGCEGVPASSGSALCPGACSAQKDCSQRWSEGGWEGVGSTEAWGEGTSQERHRQPGEGAAGAPGRQGASGSGLWPCLQWGFLSRRPLIPLFDPSSGLLVLAGKVSAAGLLGPLPAGLPALREWRAGKRGACSSSSSGSSSLPGREGAFLL